MRRNAITSLVALGGVMLTVMQMTRMRRPRGFQRITHWLNMFMNNNKGNLKQGRNQMMRMLRKVRA